MSFTTTDHVVKGAQAAVEKAMANFAQAERRLSDAKTAAGAKASDMSVHARELSSESLATVKHEVQDNPARSVGIGLAIGYLLWVVLKKK